MFDGEELRTASAATFAVERELRIQEIDAAGTMFFARAFEYASDCFVSFCRSRGIELPRILEQGRWAAPIREARAEYFRPLRFGDRVEVALVRAQVEATEVMLGYRISRLADGAVSAVVQVRHVFVSLPGFERRPVPEEIRAALLPLVRPE